MGAVAEAIAGSWGVELAESTPAAVAGVFAGGLLSAGALVWTWRKLGGLAVPEPAPEIAVVGLQPGSGSDDP